MVSQKTLNVYISVGIKYTYECQRFQLPFKNIYTESLA